MTEAMRGRSKPQPTQVPYCKHKRGIIILRVNVDYIPLDQSTCSSFLVPNRSSIATLHVAHDSDRKVASDGLFCDN
jgi:hypothetical protein